MSIMFGFAVGYIFTSLVLNGKIKDTSEQSATIVDRWRETGML